MIGDPWLTPDFLNAVRALEWIDDGLFDRATEAAQRLFVDEQGLWWVGPEPEGIILTNTTYRLFFGALANPDGTMTSGRARYSLRPWADTTGVVWAVPMKLG
jgi:hypothetical protein